MRRRRLLLSLVVGFAGCSSRSAGSDSPTDRSDDTATDPDGTGERTPTATPTEVVGTLPETDCPEDSAVPYAADEDVPPIPDPPKEFTSEAVREYVEAYEQAWQWREWSDYGEAVSVVGVAMVLSVEQIAEKRFLVRSGEASAYGQVDHNGNGTYGAFDGPPYYVSYLVTERAVWRAEGDRESSATNPIEDGRLVECF